MADTQAVSAGAVLLNNHCGISIGIAVTGGILIGVGAYYPGKTLANRANRKNEEAAASAGCQISDANYHACRT